MGVGGCNPLLNAATVQPGLMVRGATSEPAPCRRRWCYRWRGSLSHRLLGLESTSGLMAVQGSSRSVNHRPSAGSGDR